MRMEKNGKSGLESSVDIKQLKRLSIQATYEAKYEKRD